MRPGSIFTFAVIVCVLAIQFGLAASASASCDVPTALQDKIATEYAGTHIVTMADLSERNARLFQKEHGSGCPGVAKVNFYGDGRPTLAIVLISGENPKRKAELVVAREVRGAWEIRSLETTDGTPVVWLGGAGKYKDLYGQKTIRAIRPVIIFAGYGSWAILYAWDGKEAQKIQISD